MTQASPEFLIIFGKVLGVMGVMLAGAVARKTRLLEPAADASLMKLVINLLIPALFFDRVLGSPSMLVPANLYLPPVVGFLVCILGFALAWAVASLIGHRIGLVTPVARRTFVLCVGLFNYGYVSLPLAERMYGPDTQAVLIIFNFGVEAAIWSAGILIISGELDRNSWKRLFNVPFIAISLAVLINFTLGPSRVPGFIRDTSHYLGVCGIPMGLLLSGAVIYDHWRELSPTRQLPMFAAAFGLRVIALPLIFLTLAAAMPMFLPASIELQRVLLLQASMPAAMFPIVIARQYQGDMPVAIKIILGTSILSLVTIPAWILFGSWLLGV